MGFVICEAVREMRLTGTKELSHGLNMKAYTLQRYHPTSWEMRLDPLRLGFVGTEGIPYSPYPNLWTMGYS